MSEGITRKELLSRIENLKSCKLVQCSEGNYNYDEYMFGMANGLILALSIMEGKIPEFKELKEEDFLKNKPQQEHKLSCGKDEISR
jgi:hypothetical protein